MPWCHSPICAINRFGWADDLHGLVTLCVELCTWAAEGATKHNNPYGNIDNKCIIDVGNKQYTSGSAEE